MSLGWTSAPNRGPHRRLAFAAAGAPTQTGVFGAHMLVEIENDGPLTIVLER